MLSSAMAKLNSFSSSKTSVIKEFSEKVNCESVLGLGSSSQFLSLVSALCDEICTMYEITDLSLVLKGDESPNGYFLDLSVLLSELECPIESIICGSLETRFDSDSNRKTLIEYLAAEVTTARLFAFQKCNEPSTSFHNTDEVWEEVRTCLLILSVPKPESNPDASFIIRSITSAASDRLKLYENIPVPLFSTSIDLGRSLALTELVKTFNQDCRARNLLFLKRIDVTINSFLWADRIKVFETEILNMFAHRRSELANVHVPGISDLLAATQYILEIEKASSAERRVNTKSLVHPLFKVAPPSDRGGRTDPQAFVRRVNENPTRRHR